MALLNVLSLRGQPQLPFPQFDALALTPQGHVRIAARPRGRHSRIKWGLVWEDRISVLLAVLLVRYAHVAIPVVSSHSFETLLIAFLLLLAGNLFKGF
jgi:hypothetical protein